MFPIGALTVGSNGFFYGSTRQGGSYDGGVLFRMSADGLFTVLHTFSDPQNDSVDGSLPAAAPIFGPEGRLWGLAAVGGANGTGTLYQIKSDGSHFAVPYDFGTSDPQSSADGGFPAGGLILGRDGAFYGVTGGGRNGTGTVFRLAVP